MTREEALAYGKRVIDLGLNDETQAFCDMAIKALEQEPKTGYREYNDIYDHYLCGNCKTVVMDYDNYCPNCGARMESDHETDN